MCVLFAPSYLGEHALAKLAMFAKSFLCTGTPSSTEFNICNAPKFSYCFENDQNRIFSGNFL